MSNVALNWAWLCQIDSTPKFVLVALSDFADDQNECWPKLKTLCERTSFSIRAVRSALGTLRRLGLIDQHERLGESTIYTLKVGKQPKPAENSHPPAGDAAPQVSAPPRQEMPPPPAGDAGALRVLTPIEPKKEERIPPLIPPNAMLPFDPPSTAQILTLPSNAVTVAKTKMTEAEIDQFFEHWWKLYPRKTAKLAARRMYAKALKLASPMELIIGVKAYQFPSNPKYQKHPATWLHDGCWIIEENTAPVSAEPEKKSRHADAISIFSDNYRLPKTTDDFQGVTINYENVQEG